ncbi:ribonuclease HII [Marinicella gelatinilytica]|uniref:ribonuclease HII n=1 Tax=Marinicella gelatinilytica TaxID=2996017 RepID=UPI002260CE2B|nr:ribonuclease HII [Marinicella gelatinilytica]MCX7544315.1 ribonuclease HII [Marinicella gelatinilytica]
MIAGVDEAGRGPLAGPVTVAAVILKTIPDGLNDSKKLSEKKRTALLPLIKSMSVAWSVVHVSPEEIDDMNILQATLWGMQQAVQQLEVQPIEVLVDGNQVPKMTLPCRALVGGDGLEACISAASIIAKCHRDSLMLEAHQKFPEYGFNQHKGYPTKAHMEALSKWGPCAIHRRSFAPVRAAEQQGLFV